MGSLVVTCFSSNDLTWTRREKVLEFRGNIKLSFLVTVVSSSIIGVEVFLCSNRRFSKNECVNQGHSFIILDKARSSTLAANGKNCIALAADETAAVHIQLWGDECDVFEAGDIVKLTNGIFSYVRNSGLVLRAGKRGKMGEFTVAFIETPNVSEIQWNPDPDNPKRYIPSFALNLLHIFI